MQHESLNLWGRAPKGFGQAAYIRVAMKNYKQLDLKKRHKIKALLDEGHNQSQIAKNIGVHRSTISRELTRNVAKRGPTAKQYRPDLAQQKTDRRHRDKPKHHRFSELLKMQARQWLTEEKLSPELISARWALDETTEGVSHETLYKWIWAGKHKTGSQDQYLYKHLKHGRRKRKRGNYNDSRGHLPDRTSIEDRPGVVDERQRLGDIEVDLMMGKAHKSALLVLVDRATLLMFIEKLSSKKANEVASAITRRLGRLPGSFIKTLTFDNDKAFAKHQKIAGTFNADTYFTRPYTSQDKGTVENRIGVIRRWFPKGTDLRKISKERIKQVEQYLNLRPIRKFDYLNPIQQTLKYRAVNVALMT